MRVLLIASLLLGATGCTPSLYTKSVTVTKDQSGKVVQISETETVTQRGNGFEIDFQHLKGVQPKFDNYSNSNYK
jgi:hypothetical protein